MSENEKRDIREANKKISRDQQDKGTAGKVFAGRREELALNPTGKPDSDGEKAVKRAAAAPEEKSKT